MLQSGGPPPPDPNQRSFDPELTHFAFVVFDKEETAKGVLAFYEKDPSSFKSPDGYQLSVVAKTDKPKYDMSRGNDGFYQQRSSPGPTGRGGGYGGGGGSSGAYQQHQRYEGGGGGGVGGGVTRGRGKS